MHRLPAYILAGGRSSRFGSNKALALLEGVPLILRVAEAAMTRCESVTVIGRREGEFAALGLRTLADAVPGAGPLAGLHAALLDAAHAPCLLLLSCDLVMLKPHWVDSLMQHLGDAPVVAFRPEACWQPLLAIYRAVITEAVVAALNRRDLSICRLLDAVGAAAAPLPADWPDVVQVNDLRQLQAFRAP